MNRLIAASLAVAFSVATPTALGPLQFPVMFGFLVLAVYIIQPLWDDIVAWGIDKLIAFGEKDS